MAKQKLDLNDVDAVLTQMIENWPTLYRSRMAALERVFCSTYEWRNGKPYDLDSLSTCDNQWDEGREEKALSDYDQKYNPNVAVLRRRRDRAKAMFVRENAALIARAEVGEDHAFTSVPDFSSYKLKNIPLAELTPAWAAALVEYCNEVNLYDGKKIDPRNALRGFTKEYAEREHSQLKSAKEAAQECLFRLGKGSKEAEQVRAQEIQKLRYMAEQFGLKLVPMED